LIDTHDFNSDGKSDILWRDGAGDVGMWLMNGAQILQGAQERRGYKLRSTHANER
jgi:hypothetical protein